MNQKRKQKRKNHGHTLRRPTDSAILQPSRPEMSFVGSLSSERTTPSSPLSFAVESETPPGVHHGFMWSAAMTLL
jgi:hypothetical protein